MKIRHKIMTVR